MCKIIRKISKAQSYVNNSEQNTYILNGFNPHLHVSEGERGSIHFCNYKIQKNLKKLLLFENNICIIPFSIQVIINH